MSSAVGGVSIAAVSRSSTARPIEGGVLRHLGRSQGRQLFPLGPPSHFRQPSAWRSVRRVGGHRWPTALCHCRSDRRDATRHYGSRHSVRCHQGTFRRGRHHAEAACGYSASFQQPHHGAEQLGGAQSRLRGGFAHSEVGGWRQRHVANHALPLHADIASRVSTTRETVARALSDLGRQGIVSRDHNSLVVTDPGRLADMIENFRSE